MSANSPIVRRSLVATIISVLAVGLILTIVITLPPAASRSVVAVTGYQDSAEPAREAVLREVGLDFADHELRYAGGYSLSLASAVKRGAGFDFVDHEMMYAGGYGLRPAAVVERGTAFDFVDHELRYAGGYGLSPAAEAERAADFDFVDHELRYAGGYSLSLPAPSRGAQASTSWTTK
jgi:hypothetical protein